MSVCPEPRHFTAVAQMTALKMEPRLSEDVSQDLPKRELSRTAAKVPQSRWQLAWLSARSYWQAPKVAERSLTQIKQPMVSAPHVNKHAAEAASL